MQGHIIFRCFYGKQVDIDWCCFVFILFYFILLFYLVLFYFIVFLFILYFILNICLLFSFVSFFLIVCFHSPRNSYSFIYLFIWKQFNTDLFCMLYFVSFCALFYFFTGSLLSYFFVQFFFFKITCKKWLEMLWKWILKKWELISEILLSADSWAFWIIHVTKTSSKRCSNIWHRF